MMLRLRIPDCILSHILAAIQKCRQTSAGLASSYDLFQETQQAVPPARLDGDRTRHYLGSAREELSPTIQDTNSGGEVRPQCILKPWPMMRRETFGRALQRGQETRAKALTALQRGRETRAER